MTDFIGMYLCGCAFLDCANLCNEKIKSCNTVKEFELGTPAIVNCAFACELFLKLLLAIYKINNKRCHKLKELFDLLPTEVQENINEKLFEGYGGRTKNDFGIEYIQLISDAFTEWRYGYEKNRLQNETGFMFLFCNILKKESEMVLSKAEVAV